MNDPTTLTDFHGTARLFPLPNLVLFPHVVQGLHIFEPRYRQLMADALSTNQLITIVLLKPGWEPDYDGSPAIEPIACLGRITWHEQLPDGRYNLRLRGMARVQIFEEIPHNRLYRIARAELIPEFAPTDLVALREHRQALAEMVLPRFDDGPARRQLQELFDGEMPLGQVCDVLAYALPLPLEIKQSLLAEPHADRRALAMVDALRTSAARADRKFPPEFSPN
jgi:Lon protease-like protein